MHMYTIPAPLPYGPVQPPEAFQPQLIVTERQTGFSWDGLVYYGTGYVGAQRVFYRWLDEVETERTPWERFEMGNRGIRAGEPPRPEYADYSMVTRDICGFRVYHVYPLTPALIELYDRQDEIVAARRRVPCDERGNVLNVDDWRAANDEMHANLVAAGCDRKTLTDKTTEIVRELRIGYFVEDGLEQSEDIAWQGPRAELLQQSPEFQAWVAAIPKCAD